MTFKVVIPARYDSSRLPGKVLANIGGKPMVQHVYEQAQQSGAEQVVIATDHPKVYEAVQQFSATCCMTSSDHSTGTDRIAEAVRLMNWSADQIVVNVQADEPFISPRLIQQAAELLIDDQEAGIATLCAPIKLVEDLFDPNIVKVVLNRHQRAMYFSRAAIPWDRAGFAENPQRFSASVTWLRHIGIYAYRVELLRAFSQMSEAPIEAAERLEQLRLLWFGEPIAVGVARSKTEPGVDTEADLEVARKAYQALRLS